MGEANKLFRECVAEEWQKVGQKFLKISQKNFFLKAECGEQQGQREIYEQKLAKIAELYADICLYEKGTELFEGN